VEDPRWIRGGRGLGVAAITLASLAPREAFAQG